MSKHENPTGDEESGEMGTFTINFGGNGRAVGYPPTSEIGNIKFTVTFKQGATVKGPFTADGTYTMTEKIPIGVYDAVEVEVFDKTDVDSVLAVGGLTSGGTITIHTGNNDIHVTLNKTVKVSPDLYTVVLGSTKQFTASVYNSSPAVTWTISSFTGATTGIDSGGLLTVDPLETASEIWVTAIYISDTTWRGSIKVDISDGGDGSPGDPFIVYDEITLNRVGKGTGAWTGNWSLSAYYEQTEDITLISTPNWTLIGTSGTPFAGSYDGNGKTITDLTINTSAGYQGMFGAISGATAEVRNLNLVDVSITSTGGTYIGGVTGHISVGALIENCSVQGIINGTFDVGGIAGYAFSGCTIKDCSFSGTVNGNTEVGGVVGYNTAGNTVQGCYVISGSTITGTGTGANVGGVAGTNNGIVEKSYAEANVNGSQSIGGVVGHNYLTVQNCYATGNVVATNAYTYAGGVIGLNDASATVQNCYATGSVDGQDYVGGIV